MVGKYDTIETMHGWNKGLTKDTHPSLAKTSKTMRDKKIDNFSKWRERMKKEGKIKSDYLPLPHSKYLAELIGVTLGDGHIEKFPRTERLVIAANSNNHGFIKRYATLMEMIFSKRPKLMKSRAVNCLRISIYEKLISERLGIPTGKRRYVLNKVPQWILDNHEFMVAFLRGLYEAEGSFCVHKPTSTYKMLFSNRNDSLLSIVYDLVSSLGFKVNRSSFKVQVSKKEHVLRLKDLIAFRNYAKL